MSLANLKEVVEGNDVEAIKARTQDVTESAMKLGEAIYKAEQEKAGAAGEAEGSAPEGADDDVVDADFEDLDKGDKA